MQFIASQKPHTRTIGNHCLLRLFCISAGIVPHWSVWNDLTGKMYESHWIGCILNFLSQTKQFCSLTLHANVGSPHSQHLQQWLFHYRSIVGECEKGTTNIQTAWLPISPRTLWKVDKLQLHTAASDRQVVLGTSFVLQSKRSSIADDGLVNAVSLCGGRVWPVREDDIPSGRQRESRKKSRSQHKPFCQPPGCPDSSRTWVLGEVDQCIIQYILSFGDDDGKARTYAAENFQPVGPILEALLDASWSHGQLIEREKHIAHGNIQSPCRATFAHHYQVIREISGGNFGEHYLVHPDQESFTMYLLQGSFSQGTIMIHQWDNSRDNQ